MATGQNLQPRRGIVVSDVTPGASFDTGEARMWGAVERLGEQMTEAAKPGMKRKAEEIGKREGAEAAEETIAGRPASAPRPMLAWGEMAEARIDAAEQAYHAKARSDFDAQESAVQAELGHDVEAYRNRMVAIRSGYIQNAPPEYAVDLEVYATAKIDLGVADVAERAARVQQQENATAMGVRMADLSRRIADELTEAGAPTVQYQILKTEYEDVLDARLNNPAIPYSQAEADADALELQVLSKAAIYTHHARSELRSGGATAALASLETILNDPDLGPSERALVFEKARTTINREIDLATDQANMARSAQARAEEAMKKRIADNAAAIELGQPDDGLNEAEVMSVLGASGVRDWYRASAEALERNREVGSLVGLSPAEAAARIADAKAVAEGGAEFEALVGWIMDESEGSALVANDNGAGRARFGITERSHPDAWRDGDVTRQEAAAIYRREYWDAIGADGLAKDLRIVAFDAAINQGAGLAKRWIQESGGDAARYIELRRAHYRALAASDPAKYGDDLRGWLNRLDAITTRVQAMGAGNLLADRITNAREGFATDPQNFAVTHRLAAPVSIDVGAVFQGGQATAQWREAITARAATAGNLAEQYGVPQRILTNGEAAAYRDQFARDPGSAVEFAEVARTALGGRGARDLLREVARGDIAPALIHIGDLAAAGGSARFADNAARGLQLKAAGETLDTEVAADLRAAIDGASVPFANNPDLLQAIRQTAEAAALADQADGAKAAKGERDGQANEVRGARVRRTAEYYAQGAMGRTVWDGRTYGGVAPVNGRPTLLPTWLNVDRAEDALEELAESWVEQGNGPVYANDTPMPANVVARLRMTMQSDGRYLLTDREGRTAYTRRGAGFTVDLEQMRPFLSARLGRTGVKPDGN